MNYVASGKNNWAYLNLMTNAALVEISRLVMNDNEQVFRYVSKTVDYISYNYYKIQSIDDIANA